MWICGLRTPLGDREIQVPACAACATHVGKGQSQRVYLWFVGLAIGAGRAALDAAWWGAIVVAALVGIVVVWWYRRHTRAARAASGHRTQFVVVDLPEGGVGLRTGNPRFARELRERNPQFAQ